jgi:uncharacterized C2H2 Zn-finger protein
VASELVRNVWCDIHGDDDRRDVEEPGLDVTFSVGAISVVMDLCQECITKHVDPLAELLVTHGRKASQEVRPASGATVAADGERMTCPECGKPYAYRASLQSHMMDIHGKVLPRKRGGGGPVTCPHCGKTYQGAAGLASHVKTSHPESWTGPKTR